MITIDRAVNGFIITYTDDRDYDSDVKQYVALNLSEATRVVQELLASELYNVDMSHVLTDSIG